jgi:hypothetical protein
MELINVLLSCIKYTDAIFEALTYQMFFFGNSKNFDVLKAKVGIRNLGPHLRNCAILRTTKSIAELRTKKSCGTAIADLENLTSVIPQLSTASCPFPLLSTKDIFRTVCFSGNQKFALKGQ